MLPLLLRWLFISLSIMAVPYLVDGIEVESFGSALAAAAVLALFNVVLKPILFIFTLPLTVFSLGFFLLILNAFLFQLVAFFVGGLTVDSFWSAFFASIIVSICSWISQLSIKREGQVTRVVVTQQRPKRVRDLN